MFANLFCITHYKLLLLLYKCFGVLLKFLMAVAGKYTAAWTVNTVQFCFVNFVVIFFILKTVVSLQNIACILVHYIVGLPLHNNQQHRNNCKQSIN